MATQTLGVAKVIDEGSLSAFQIRVVVLCALIAFAEGFDAQSAGFVAPTLARVWSLSPNMLGLFFSLGLVGLMLGALFIAPLADKFGRRPLLLACLVGFGLGSIGMAESSSIEVLYTFRFLTGLGIGAAMPNVIALTSEYVPRRIRSFMVVLMFNGFILGSITAGLTAARLAVSIGYEPVFLIGGIVPLVLSVIMFFLLPESIHFLASQEGRQDKVAALMRRINASLPAGARFTLGESRASRMSVKALFRDGRAGRTILLWILVFCSLLVLFLLTNWLPTQIRSLGVALGIAILMGALLQLGGMVGIVQGWMIDKWGPAKTLTMAYLIAAFAIAGLAFAGNSVPLLALTVFCAGFGIIGGQTAANPVASMAYPTEIRSTGVGWFLGVGRLGSIVGPALAGHLITIGWSSKEIFLLATIPALIAAAAAFALSKHEKAITEQR
ncbi:MAG TPA: MFS transporter [Steroidobacteraceae bacterium]|nr:MFS transporter [Steroidobacteraceae bacterium]